MRVDRLVASSRSFAPAERLDLLVHALSQAPPRVRGLIASGAAPAPLRRLAGAYGMEHRLSFAGPEAIGDLSDTDLVVYPSALNRERAPLRPADVDRHVVLRDDAWIRRTASAWRFADLVEATYLPEDPPAPAALEPPSGQRVLLVTNIPAHSRLPLFDALSTRLERAGSTLRVLFLARGYPRRSWMTRPPLRFDHRFLRSVGVPLGRERHPFLPRDLGRALGAFAPTVVVGSGFSPLVSGRVAAFARRRNRPFLLWSGETAATAGARSGVPPLVRRALARAATAGLAYGHASGEYLRSLDARLPVVYVRNSTPTAEPDDPADAAAGPLHCLTVAELSSPRKGIDVLIDAFRMLDASEATLTVVGDGPERAGLEARAAGLEDRIRFAGAVPSDRVLERYRDADCFLFPSRSDIFGLVLVEALAAGLATVTSADPGAVHDLTADGQNALVVAGREPRAWAAAIRRLRDDPALRHRLAGHGAATVRRRWTLEHSAAAFVAGLRLAVSAPTRR